MNEKEQWIDQHLRSEEFLQKAAPGSDLMARLKAIPVKSGAIRVLIPKRIIWSVAAGITLLIVLNLISIQSYRKAERAQETSSTTVNEDAYFSYMKQL